MRTRLAAIAAAALLTVTMAACSSDSGGDTQNADAGNAGTANVGSSQVSDAAGGDAAAESGAEPQADAGSDTAADAAADDVAEGSGEDAAATGNGDLCEVLKTFYHDITTLPERVDSGGVTDADVEAILAPVEARNDLPAKVFGEFMIFRAAIESATRADSGARVEHQFDSGGPGEAMDDLVNSTRMECDLPDTWPEDG